MANEIKSAMKLNGKADLPGFRMIAALIDGAINDVPCAYLEFAARNKKLDLSELVGFDMGFSVDDAYGRSQEFWGTCISAETKGNVLGEGIFVAEIRPWLWFLTRSHNNRIYQNMNATAIVQDVLGDYGFSGDLKIKHTGSDPDRDYCVQYRETDLEFIKRLMEEEGFYFYFEHNDGTVSMILTDQPSTHAPSTEAEKFIYGNVNAVGVRDQISKWVAVEKAVTGKVTLRDYDFTKPSSDLTAMSELQSGSHSHKSYEFYQYPGRYKDVSDGEQRANSLIEETASGHKVWSAAGNMLNLNVGKLFEIEDHPRHEKSSDKSFMVTQFAQFLDFAGDSIPGGSRIKSDPVFLARLGSEFQEVFKGGTSSVGSGTVGPQSAEAFREGSHTLFKAVKKDNPYRGPKKTPRPQISGIQTAIVTGAPGEEISVDEYGRIKVQFPWDRQGQKDDKTTCWVRTMMPWTGKNWGMVALPRVGQEVVIQFEEGDPDRPLCIGMLYNAETMPPYELPANATRTGIKTNSSKGGGGYNELMFEDKKGEELVRFMAEKDYVQNVENSAHIKVGYPHGDDIKAAYAQGAESMKLEVKNHLDEIVEDGDYSFAIQKGNVKNTVEQGNYTTSVMIGDISISADAGKIDMEAAKSITLVCGQSSITLEPAQITIKSVQINTDSSTDTNIDAGISINIKAGVKVVAEGTAGAELKSAAITVVKGSTVMIN